MEKHPGTAGINPFLLQLGMLEIMNRNTEGVRRWIEVLTDARRASACRLMTSPAAKLSYTINEAAQALGEGAGP